MGIVKCRNNASNTYGTVACNPQSCSAQGTCSKTCSDGSHSKTCSNGSHGNTCSNGSHGNNCSNGTNSNGNYMWSYQVESTKYATNERNPIIGSYWNYKCSA